MLFIGNWSNRVAKTAPSRPPVTVHLEAGHKLIFTSRDVTTSDRSTQTARRYVMELELAAGSNLETFLNQHPTLRERQQKNGTFRMGELTTDTRVIMAEVERYQREFHDLGIEFPIAGVVNPVLCDAAKYALADSMQTDQHGFSARR